MARNKVTISFKGFDEYMEKLDKLGGNDLMKKAVDAGLKTSKQYVNQQLVSAMQKSNLPAHGKFSHGTTKNSIDKNFNVEWQGLIGSTKIGFDFSKSGMTSIVLMYGTPKIAPVEGLYDAVYGTKTKNKIKKLQKEAIDKVIQRYMEG